MTSPHGGRANPFDAPQEARSGHDDPSWATLTASGAHRRADGTLGADTSRGITHFCSSRRGWIRRLGPVSRLDLGGPYDPGGLQRVEFALSPAVGLLVLPEYSPSHIDRDANLAWTIEHGDLTTSVRTLEGGVLEVASDGVARRVLMRNGSLLR